MEDEKLPVSKRTPTDVVESIKKSKKKKSQVKEVTNSDEDVESVESFSSTSSVTKKRRKTNKTGFPTPKKKKKLADANSSSSVKDTPKKLSEKSTSKSEKSSKPSPKKLKNPKQKKMDDYLTKKSSKSNPVASGASKRSAALKAKNYSEVESDTDSLLESSMLTPDKKLKPSSVQKSVKKR